MDTIHEGKSAFENPPRPAGPAGLVAALNLAKNGVTFRIIDKEPTYHTGTRGAGIQARTEELLHFLGILPDVQKRSLKLMPRRLYKLPGGTEPFETTSLSSPADPTPSTPYIDGMLISQSNTEDIIRAHLSKYCVQVELGTELHAFEQNEEQITAHLIKHDDNVTEETVTCDWLIGTDGGRGATRKLLGLDFAGVSRQDEGAVVGKIEVEGLSTDYWHQWGDTSTQLVLIRPTEFAGIFYFNAAGNVDYQLQLIQRDRDALIDFIYKTTDRCDLKFGAVRWISEFRPNIRMVDSGHHKDRLRSGALSGYPHDIVRIVVVYPRDTQPRLDAASGAVLQVVDEKGHAYNAYACSEVLVDSSKLQIVILRPDMVVGAVVFGLDGVNQYFANIFKDKVVDSV